MDMHSLVSVAREIHLKNSDLVAANDQVQVGKLIDITSKKAVESFGEDICAVNGSYPIRIFRVNAPDCTYLHSLVLGRKKEAVILLSPSLNPCWTRFCSAKELAHLFIGCSTTTNDSAMLLTLARNSRFNAATLEAEMDTETFCLYLAIEILLPWTLRGKLSDMHHEKGFTTLQIAKHFMVPCAIIEQYFECEYGALSFKANKDVKE